MFDAHLASRNRRDCCSRTASVSARVSLILVLFLVTFSWVGVASATPISGFVISEIMYEPTGNDNGTQWIELYNGTGSAIDLSDYQIEWGRSSLSNSVALSGSLASGDTYVIGGPTSSGVNGAPIFDQTFNFNPNLGDGGHKSREDGVGLTQISTSTLMHIVVYGGDGAGTIAFTDEQGNTATVIDDSGLTPGESLEFLGTDVWQVQPISTPGNPHSSIAIVPEPTIAMLLVLGLGGLAYGGRKID